MESILFAMESGSLDTEKSPIRPGTWEKVGDVHRLSIVLIMYKRPGG